MNEILKLFRTDQQLRSKLRSGELSPEDFSRAEKKIMKSSRQLVSSENWPQILDAGADIAEAAFVLVLHIGDSEFQKNVLNKWTGLADNRIENAWTAYLEDKIRVGEGRPQLYGTQFYK